MMTAYQRDGSSSFTMKLTVITLVMMSTMLGHGMAAAHAATASPMIAFSNEANPGSAGRDAGQYMAHAKAVRAADRHIVALLNAKNYPKAAVELKQATQRYQDAWAGFALGNLYAAGLGVSRSPARAFHWYLWSANAGDHFAQRRVANAYLNGEGVARNPQEAAYWFRIGMAVPQQVNADYWLAETYKRGHLAPINLKKYHYYLQRSQTALQALAQEPNGAAAYDMGLSYAYGRGVPVDRGKALQWLQRAMQLHYAPAAIAIHRLETASQSHQTS
ncbi:MAG: tetratricopeptide repeat protein [Acidithiobacillus sp.]